ncbi:MAG: DUF4352 domain-containing protein [Bacteroidota bacterium]
MRPRSLTLPLVCALVAIASWCFSQQTGTAPTRTQPTGTLYISFGGAQIPTPENSLSKPDTGYIFYRMGVALANLSTEPVAVRPSDFHAEAFNVVYDPDPSADKALGNLPRLHSVTLRPGGRIYGYLAFQVPANNRGIGFFWTQPASRRYYVQMQESKALTDLAVQGAAAEQGAP